MSHDPIDLIETRRGQLPEHELNLVGAVLADPAPGIVIAEAAGVTDRHFSQPDLRLMYLAADVGRELDKLGVLKLARAALRADGLWDDGQIAANSGWAMRHSNETLHAIADSFPWSPTAIRLHARLLLGAIERLETAGRLVDVLRETLAGDDRPQWVPPKPLAPGRNYHQADRRERAA